MDKSCIPINQRPLLCRNRQGSQIVREPKPLPTEEPFVPIAFDDPEPLMLAPYTKAPVYVDLEPNLDDDPEPMPIPKRKPRKTKPGNADDGLPDNVIDDTDIEIIET